MCDRGLVNGSSGQLALPRKVAPHVVGLEADQVTAVIDEAVKEILDELENEPWPEGMRQLTG